MLTAIQTKRVRDAISVALFIGSSLGWSLPVQAQAITPAVDGTGTTVLLNGNRFEITGGQISGDRANLFHSFQQFGLNQNQIANFLAAPGIQNILGRVVGGEASIINGLIQVIGSNANLFLMNPAGIVFGANASLNVPASFTATTANGIGFGNRWFNAIDANNYALLNGLPTSFAFTMPQPGAIVNAGNLAVESGQSLALLGGTVVNTGQLSASGGAVIVTAIPGSRFVRLSQPGSLLSYKIELATPDSSQPQAINFPIASLPQLLTGGNLSNATGLTINSNGQVELTGSNIAVNSGDVIVRNISAQTATLSASRNLTLVESQLQTTGDLNLLATDTVIVRDSVAVPFRAFAGGNLHIQGNQGIDILALNHLQQETPFQSGGNLSLASDGNISGDAHFASRGRFSILNLSGQPGNFVSLYDPIISANRDVQFGNYTGVSLKVEANGSIVGGDITITGPDTALVGTDPDVATLKDGRSLILRAGLATLTNPPNLPQFGVPTEPTDFLIGFSGLPVGSIQVGTIRLNAPTSTGNAGALILSALGDVRTGDINRETLGGTSANGAVDIRTQGTIQVGSITTNNFGIDAAPITLIAGGNITAGNLDAINSDPTSKGGDITLNAGGTISTSGINSFSTNVNVPVRLGDNGGNVTLTATRDIVMNCPGACITSFSDSSENKSGGNVVLTSTQGSISLNRVGSSGDAIASYVRGTGTAGQITLSAGDRIDIVGNLDAVALEAGSGGAVSLTANNGIRTGTIQTRALLNGGAITLTSTNGDIDTTAGELVSSSTNGGVSGAITLKTSGNINTGNVFAEVISTVGNQGNGGNITLTSTGGRVVSDNLTTSGSIGGNVTISALTRITTGNINTSATIGNGGNVTLDPLGDVQVGFINAQGGTAGVGGTVDITTQQFFRATNTFRDRNNLVASISTAGGLPGSSITIRHGGQGLTPFIVGDASINGTAGAISTGVDNTIATGIFPFTYRQQGASGNIQIISVDPIALPERVGERIPIPPLEYFSDLVFDIEQRFTEQFEASIGQSGTRIKTLSEIQDELSEIERQSKVKPAIIYATFEPEDSLPCSKPNRPILKNVPLRNSDRLQMVLVTSRSVICKSIPNTRYEKVQRTAEDFRNAVKDTETNDSKKYLPLSQQLYNWLISYLQPDLQKEGIQNLVFNLDESLRSIPLAALHGEQDFIIRHYSLSYIASMSLTDATYANIKSAQVLAMGDVQVPGNTPLKNVPVELAAITSLRPGVKFSGSDFTLKTLESNLQQARFKIIHLATHGKYAPDKPDESIIQFINEDLTFESARTLNWKAANVELLVLSACETILGGRQFELGFAGLTVQLGVKSAIASLWKVDDQATTALMIKFYDNLTNSANLTIKAQALQQAQLAMLDQQSYQILSQRLQQLLKQTPELRQAPIINTELEKISSDYSRPYFWSSFAIVGNPW